MQLSGTMYGGYTSDSDSLLAFRLLEWCQPFALNQAKRGFFDLAGNWRGPELITSGNAATTELQLPCPTSGRRS